VFVTGCHRSGTSLLASLLHGLVCDEDPSARGGDLELKLENPLGFFESQRLVQANEALFDLIGRTWDTPPLLAPRWDQAPCLHELQRLRSRLSFYALEQCWVDKDPRLCITYPAYLHILLRRVPLVVALREPLAVATSLYARNGFSLNRGLVIWLLYNYHIASQLNADDLLVFYDHLLCLEDPEQGCMLHNEIDGFLERQGHPRPEISRWKELLQRYLRPDYNRSDHALPGDVRNQVNPQLLEVCRIRFQSLQTADDNQQRLQVFREEFSAIPRVAFELVSRELMLPEAFHANHDTLNKQLEAQLHRTRAEIQEQNVLIKHQQHQLDLLYSSSSWRFTAPLRSIFDRMRRF